MNQLPTVTLPAARVRQWRSLIAYRWTLVGRRTAIKNHIRSILDRQGLTLPAGKRGWTAAARAALELDARPAERVSDEELWRFELHLELVALDQVETLIAPVEAKLEALAKADARVEKKTGHH